MINKLIMSFLILVFTPTIGICADFNFAGIDWSDNPNQVFNKLADKKLVAMVGTDPIFITGTGDDDKPMKIDLENIIYAMVDDAKKKKLRDGSSVDRNIQEEMGSRNKIKMMSVGAPEDSIIGGSEFSFTYETDQLLSYKVWLSRDADFDEFIKMLIKKYGNPTETKYCYVWNGNGQSLYYYNPNQNMAIIYYLNDDKIDSYINNIEQLEKSIKNRKIKSESEKSEKLF